MISYYNHRICVAGAHIRTCCKITKKRINVIAKRIREYGEDRVMFVIDMAVESRFLNYEARCAPVDIDWIMSPNKFINISEGQYSKDELWKRESGESSNSREKFLWLMWDAVDENYNNEERLHRRLAELRAQRDKAEDAERRAKEEARSNPTPPQEVVQPLHEDVNNNTKSFTSPALGDLTWKLIQARMNEEESEVKRLEKQIEDIRAKRQS